MRTAVFTIALVVSSACTCGREDVGGTYVVDGELTVAPRGGASSRTTIARETITVKLTSRHYQYGSYEMTVRGCNMRGEGTLSPAVVSTDRCMLDGPSGAFAIHPYALVTPTSGGGVDILMNGPLLEGDGGPAGTFDYKVHGVPKGP